MSKDIPAVETSSGGGERPEAAAGLPSAPPEVHRTLHEAGIDPDRLSILHLGSPPELVKYRIPPWTWRMAVGYVLWLLLYQLDILGVVLSVLVTAALSPSSDW